MGFPAIYSIPIYSIFNPSETGNWNWKQHSKHFKTNRTNSNRLVPTNIRLDEDVLKTSWRGISSSSSKDVLKTSSRCFNQDEHIHLTHTPSEDVFKTSCQVFKIPCSLFSIKLQTSGNPMKRRLKTQVFSCDICKIFKKTFVTEEFQWLLLMFKSSFEKKLEQKTVWLSALTTRFCWKKVLAAAKIKGLEGRRMGIAAN